MKLKLDKRKLFILFISLLSFFMFKNVELEDVTAWKLNTHVYSANLILEDVRDQHLEINGTSYRIPDEFYNALTNYPESYRAGSLGPDVYPDLITGQGSIHPGSLSNDISAGDYLELMVSKYSRIPDTHPEKQKILAFILGYSLHYSGDLFGHSFINEYAGKAFPSIEEIATSEENAKVALRHIVLEGYVDSLVPEDQTTGENISIDAPLDFIKDVLLYEANREYTINEYFESLVNLRDTLKEVSDNMKAYDDDQYLVEYLWDTNYAGYLDEWQKDIDTALYDWVEANQQMARYMLDHEVGHTDTYVPLTDWVTENGTSIIGFPDFSLVDGLTELLADILPQDLLDELNEYIQETALIMVEETTGVDVEEFMNAIKNPNQLIDTDLFRDGENTSAIINDRLNNFGETSNPDEIEFLPFYNTIMMGKITLLGQDNLNSLFPNSTFEPTSMKSGFKELKVTISTGENSVSWDTDDYTKGTDDDVYFYIITTSGETHSFLLDKPGYNDFESGDNDTYTLELEEYITKDQISHFGVRKNEIVFDDWWPTSIKVVINETEQIYYNNDSFEKVYRDNTDWESERLYLESNITYSEFDPSIITFISSLDDSRQWINSTIYLQNRDVFDSIFIGYEAPTFNVEEYTNFQIGLGDTGLPQLQAFDYLGEELTISLYDSMTLEPIIFDTVGTYEVIAKTTDSYENSAEMFVNVDVVEFDIALNPSVDTVFVGDEHIDTSVTITTLIEDYTFETINNVDTSTPGTYEIHYIVTLDSYSITTKRIVTVIEKKSTPVFDIGTTLTSLITPVDFIAPTCSATIDGVEVECLQEGTVDTSTAGLYEIYYYFEGYEERFKMNVKVSAKPNDLLSMLQSGKKEEDE